MNCAGVVSAKWHEVGLSFGVLSSVNCDLTVSFRSRRGNRDQAIHVPLTSLTTLLPDSAWVSHV